MRSQQTEFEGVEHEISGGKHIKRLLVAAAFVAVLLSVELIVTFVAEKNAVWRPNYDMKNIEKTLVWELIGLGKPLGQGEYDFLLEQTGLGKSAVDTVIAENVDAFVDYQADFFKESYTTCEKIGLFTYEERFRKNGFGYGVDYGNRDYIVQFDFADIRNGDILIGNNTHSFGWRHGHAAIVVDAAKGKTLEAVLWGHPSKLQNLDKWRSYPRVAVLRISQDVAEKMGYSQSEVGSMAADYALKNAVGVDYKLLSGLWKKTPKEMSATQCAHLVWCCYASLGLDIDHDCGWLVTPYDIANSNLVEVVQVYGMNPHKPWL